MPTTKGYVRPTHNRRLLPSASLAASPAPPRSPSKFSTAASATATCTWSATSGATQSIRWFPATRSWAASRPRAAQVTKFKVGEIAAIGVIVDSCRQCAPCKRGDENYCDQGPTLTYAATDRVDGSITMGGYSTNYVVDERFAHPVPANLDLAAVGSAALRRHYHLLAAAPLEGGPRQEGGHRRAGRTGPHGAQIRARHGRAHGAVHHQSAKEGRRPAAGRR